MIDGNFPDYEKAIPINNHHVFQLNRKKLLEIVKRKMVLESDNSKLVRFFF